MIYSNDTYDVIQDISTYTRRDFKSVYDTSRGKWYMLNNLNAYEEYGIYGTDFSSYYVGKLVEVNGHEYEWDGTEWVDLGEDIISKYIQLPNSTSLSNSAYYNTGIKLKNTDKIEFKIKTPESNGNKWRQILCSYSPNNQFNQYSYALYTNLNNTKFGMNWWSYGQSRLFNDTAFDMAANTVYVFEIEVGTGITKINGVTQANSGGNNNTGTLPGDLMLGAGYSFDPGFNGKIYYLKVYDENNELIGYFQADNSDGPKFKNMLTETLISKNGSGTASYGDDSIRPKDYATKATPTITNYWAGRIFRNGYRIVKALQGDELLNLKYRDKNVLIKSEEDE